jgi:hypothetical protein
MTCRICGAVMGDENLHLAWHIETGTADPHKSGCPLDGSPLSVASAGPEGGYNHWMCGHGYRWIGEKTPPNPVGEVEKP